MNTIGSAYQLGALSVFSPVQPAIQGYPTEVQSSGADIVEGQTPRSTAADRANELGATESESSPRTPDSREPALSDPSSPEYHRLQELKTRDREVRNHEMAHLAAAGPHARGGPFYDFDRGADGRQYAVGGHVNIDTSTIPGDPKATLLKAETVRRAALAPAEPSPEDRRVATDAVALATEARMEIATERREDLAARLESRSRNGESATEETPENAKAPSTERSSLIARLAAGGALSEVASAGSQIDLHT